MTVHEHPTALRRIDPYPPYVLCAEPSCDLAIVGDLFPYGRMSDDGTLIACAHCEGLSVASKDITEREEFSDYTAVTVASAPLEFGWNSAGIVKRLRDGNPASVTEQTFLDLAAEAGLTFEEYLEKHIGEPDSAPRSGSFNEWRERRWAPREEIDR